MCSSDLLGALATCLLPGCVPRPAPAPATPGMSVCELVGDSTRYRNTMVTVHGLVVSGFETFSITSDDCRTDNRAGAMIWLEFPGQTDQSYADGPTGQALFALLRRPATEVDSMLLWITPIPVTFVATSQWSRLDHYLRMEGHHLATLTGRLDVVRGSLIQRSKDGQLEVSGGFGHMGGFSRRIVIHTVDGSE